MKKVLLITIGILIPTGIGVFGVPYAAETAPQNTPTPLSVTTLPLASPSPIARTSLQAAAYGAFLELFGNAEPRLIEPVEEFHARATIKRFGTFITPDTSPVEDERFSGYHVGVDAEFSDTTEPVPVFAVADGAIVFRQWVKGYGGVIIVRHMIQGQPLLALYGHVDSTSFPPASVTQVSAGEQIAVLGAHYSHETDNGRKHLHFSLRPDGPLDVRGYVTTEEELASWLNPFDFYQ